MDIPENKVVLAHLQRKYRPFQTIPMSPAAHRVRLRLLKSREKVQKACRTEHSCNIVVLSPDLAAFDDRIYDADEDNQLFD